MFVDVFEACVAAAREDNAAVLNQLQSELKSVELEKIMLQC